VSPNTALELRVGSCSGQSDWLEKESAAASDAIRGNELMTPTSKWRLLGRGSDGRSREACTVRRLVGPAGRWDIPDGARRDDPQAALAWAEEHLGDSHQRDEFVTDVFEA